MAVGDGFHVDSSGNLWLGSTRTTFDATTRSEAPFYVYADGSIVANSGTFSGDISGASGTFTGDLSGADISGGTINIGNGTFQVDSSGNMTASSATLSGYLGVGSDFDDLTESGSIVGWVLDSANGRFVGENGSGQYLYLDSSGNIAGNYTQGSTGWAIYADGSAEFQDIIARGTISGTVDTNLFIGSGGNFKTSSGTSRVEVAGSNPASLFWIKSSSTTGSIQASADEFIIQSYTGDTLTLNAGVGQTDTLNLNSGTLNIKADTAIVTNTGTSLSLGGSTGTPGQVITRNNAGGMSWTSTSSHSHTGYTFPNSGTLLSTDTHSHNSTNTVLNTNTSFTGMINHIAETVGNSGSAHGLTLANVTTLGNANVLTSATHSHGTNNINSISSTYTNNVTAYDVAFSAAGAFNLYNTINTALGNKANNSHGTHADGNYLTNNNHSHGNTMTPNNHTHNFGNDITGFSANNHNHTGYLSNDHVQNVSDPHGINSHSNSNTAHGISNKANQADFSAHLQVYHGGSDERLKTNIIDTTFGLEYIKTLRPVDYEFTASVADEYFGLEDSHMKNEFLKPKHGFIAQEVRTATFDNHASNNAFGGLGYKEALEGDTLENVQTLDLQMFIGPIVKAIQELSGKIDLLEARVEELEGV